MIAIPSENDNTFLPPEVKRLEDLDISEFALEGLILRLLYTTTTLPAFEISERICLPFYGVIEDVMRRLRDQALIDIVKGEMASFSYIYQITDAGRSRALQYFQQTSYVGPAPVSLKVYTRMMHEQSIHNLVVDEVQLRASLQGMEFEDDVIQNLGPAVNSAHSIFLYGAPGNGKTSLCERIVSTFGSSLFIPYAVDVQGQIIRLYDEHNHVAIHNDADPRLGMKRDLRFKLIKRPVVIVAGELTLETLDLIWNPDSRYYDAPFQMKANGGALMVDDFGRQRIEPKQLLNRWILPLEKRVDYLTLHTGTKFEIPFDQLIIFSTNLNPSDLVDEAFARRIRYKIPVSDPSVNLFKRIWRNVSESKGIPYSEEVVSAFLQKYMIGPGRSLRGCIPRDILEHVLDLCRFKNIDLKSQPEILWNLVDFSASTYFVAFGSKI